MALLSLVQPVSRWTPDDALAGRCSVAQVGHACPAPPVQLPSPLELRAAALLGLLHIVQAGGRDGVDAARLLLEHATSMELPGTSTASLMPTVPAWASKKEGS